jgi:hypothetical protein
VNIAANTAYKINQHHWRRTNMRTTKMRVISKTLSLAVLLLLITPALAGKLYRWVDENGKVHYSDKIPPQHADLSHDRLSNRGIRTSSMPRAKTEEELQRERELERLRAQQQELIEKQLAEDRVLLRTFRSEDDIILARDGKIEAIDVMIRVIQSNIRRYQAKLADMQRRAATLEKTARPVPGHLIDGIDNTLSSINKAYSAINRKEQEKLVISDVFARDQKRFRELKNLTPLAAETEHKQNLSSLKLASCSGPRQCDQAWKLAENFVLQHATTRMQMLSGDIIMTKAPAQDQDISITVSRIADPDADRTLLFMDLFCRETPRGKEHCNSAEVLAIRSAFKEQIEAKQSLAEQP